MLTGVQNGMPMPFPKYDIQPVYSIQQAVERREQMVSFVKQIMIDGIDFGSIPGTGKGDEPGKPTLLKPGAEKLLSFFGLSVTLQCEKVEDWDGSEHGGEPLFSYTYRACAFRGTLLIAQADGNANSRESKYRFRWINETDIPPSLNKERLMKRGGNVREPIFAIQKAETSGKYGKSQEYWDNFKEAMANGTGRPVWIPKRGGGEDMEGYEIDSTVYRVPNEDIPSQVNTLIKMAQKRAIVAVALLAVNASEFFTQDVEDLVDSYQTDKSSATATPAAIAPQDAHRGERDAIQAYLATLPPTEAEKRRAEIAKALKVETFNLLDVDRLPADWLTWITNKITKWEKSKPVDGAPAEPTPPVDAQVIVPSVPTLEEQADILKAEAAAASKAQADDEPPLEDPFADS